MRFTASADMLQAVRDIFVGFFFSKQGGITSMRDPRWAKLDSGIGYFIDLDAQVTELAARMHLSASDANRLLPDRSQTLMQLRVMAAGVRLWAEDNFRRDPTWSFDPRRISQSKLEHLFGYIRGLAGPNNLTETSYRKALVAFIVIFMDKHFGDAPVNGANHLAEAHDGEARREIDELLFQAGHL
jgi:hypothetical protein